MQSSLEVANRGVMRQVIYQFSRELDPRSLIPSLEEFCQEGKDDFVFQDLVAVLPKGHAKESFSCQMGDHVGLAMIGDPYAIIWNPTPLDRDWFTKLHSEGYRGKKILLHTGIIRGGRIPKDEDHMVKVFGKHSDCSIDIMYTDDLALQIYRFLRK